MRPSAKNQYYVPGIFSGKIVFDASKPDGTMQKLLDVSLLNSRGWKATTGLEEGLRVAYRLFLEKEKVCGRNTGSVPNYSGKRP